MLKRNIARLLMFGIGFLLSYLITRPSPPIPVQKDGPSPPAKTSRPGSVAPANSWRRVTVIHGGNV
jgi:hypothetical protein